jgi:hypothetical protein
MTSSAPTTIRQRLDALKPQVLAVATRHGASNLRIYGSIATCPASSPLADWRQSSWPLRGTDRPPVVAGDNRGAMTMEATRKLSHPSVRAIASTDFL